LNSILMANSSATTAKTRRSPSLDSLAAVVVAAMTPSGTQTTQPRRSCMSTMPRARWALNERIAVGRMMPVEVATEMCIRTASSTPASPRIW
jgi:hypothetical protein